jgi:hypothetical protein
VSTPMRRLPATPPAGLKGLRGACVMAGGGRSGRGARPHAVHPCGAPVPWLPSDERMKGFEHCSLLVCRMVLRSTKAGPAVRHEDCTVQLYRILSRSCCGTAAVWLIDLGDPLIAADRSIRIQQSSQRPIRGPAPTTAQPAQPTPNSSQQGGIESDGATTTMGTYS